MICEYNDEGTTMFLILKGRIGVFLPHIPDAERRDPVDPDFTMDTGELAGELAFALRRRRTAALRCLEDTAVLAFSYTQMIKSIEDIALRKQLEETLSGRILARIIENVWNTAAYFGNTAKSGILTAPWLTLLPFCKLTSVAWV